MSLIDQPQRSAVIVNNMDLCVANDFTFSGVAKFAGYTVSAEAALFTDQWQDIRQCSVL